VTTVQEKVLANGQIRRVVHTRCPPWNSGVRLDTCMWIGFNAIARLMQAFKGSGARFIQVRSMDHGDGHDGIDHHVRWFDQLDFVWVGQLVRSKGSKLLRMSTAAVRQMLQPVTRQIRIDPTVLVVIPEPKRRNGWYPGRLIQCRVQAESRDKVSVRQHRDLTIGCEPICAWLPSEERQCMTGAPTPL
jgi:hypothetical protein